MKKYLIEFEKMSWERVALGVKHKIYTMGNQKIRLVEFSDDFIEDNWCTREHIGYVLEGKMLVNFSGNFVSFKSGDGMFIQKGEANKHLAKIPKGEKALLILFEKI